MIGEEGGTLIVERWSGLAAQTTTVPSQLQAILNSQIGSLELRFLAFFNFLLVSSNNGQAAMRAPSIPTVTHSVLEACPVVLPQSTSIEAPTDARPRSRSDSQDSKSTSQAQKVFLTIFFQNPLQSQKNPATSMGRLWPSCDCCPDIGKGPSILFVAYSYF